MGKLIAVVVIVGAIVAAWVMFNQPPDPAAAREKAHGDPHEIYNYWLQALLDDRVEDMQSVSDGVGKAQCESILQEVREEEKLMGIQYDSFSKMRIGANDAIKAILSSSEDSGGMFGLTLMQKKKDDGKYWIIRVTTD